MAVDMDKLLRQAFDQIAKEEYENRPVEIPEHRFSLRFHWKMHKLFRMSGAGKKEGVGKTGGSPMELFRPIRSKRKMAAIALLILMLVGGTTIAAEPFIRWLQNFYIEHNEDHVVVQNNELDESVEHTKENFRKYRLTEVPEGYSLESEKFDEGFQRYLLIYINEEDTLFLKQTWQEDKSAENLTSDNQELMDVKVNGFTGYFAEDDGIGSLVLSNGVYKIVLGGEFSKEELVQLANKLELVDEPVD
ncbi:MAG: DUF4367 domain-containing protein [Lachnospiraceae bacterium]|nr:DUF4367 domain-containing protein [Lachnospiraceae bacterium]